VPYAGIAYEIQLLSDDGKVISVNPVGYRFHTGDRFQVALRPSLPGVINVYNTDPRGVTHKIDSQSIAGGKLMKLGVYRFVHETGEEKLRIVLSPCSTPVLLAATRSIVRAEEADAPDPAPAANPAPKATAVKASGSVFASRPTPLQGCSVLAEPSRPKTRSIEKVEAEGETAFALDPASSEEVTTGRYASREVTIVMLHD
jgi:hypothetical protein